jgi:hypothetical protein
MDLNGPSMAIWRYYAKVADTTVQYPLEKSDLVRYEQDPSFEILSMWLVLG